MENIKKENKKMKKLHIKLAGHDFVYAEENTEKKGKQPDYKGDGVAVWVREAKEKTKQPEPEKIEA
jgi:hypothetical protein